MGNGEAESPTEKESVTTGRGIELCLCGACALHTLHRPFSILPIWLFMTAVAQQQHSICQKKSVIAQTLPIADDYSDLGVIMEEDQKITRPAKDADDESCLSWNPTRVAESPTRTQTRLTTAGCRRARSLRRGIASHCGICHQGEDETRVQMIRRSVCMLVLIGLFVRRHHSRPRCSFTFWLGGSVNQPWS